jgi:signal peptidase I
MVSNKITNSQAKHTSSETLLKRCALKSKPTGHWNGNTDLFSEVLGDTLNRGHSIRFHAPGNSMYPTICDGDLIVVEPIRPAVVNVGDIILYRNKSGITVHRVTHILKRSKENLRSALQGPQDRSISETLEFLLRGDAAITDDDPVRPGQILGKVVSIERNGRRINPYYLRIKLRYKTRRLVSCLKRVFFSHTG